MTVLGRSLKGAAIAVRVVPLIAGSLLLFLATIETSAQPPAERETKTVQGRVKRFTSAPKGEIDGAVLDDGTWLHWPPHLQDVFRDIAKVGDRVRATGRIETGPAGDTKFEVQKVTNLSANPNSDATAENPDFANGPPPRRPGRRGKAAPPSVPSARREAGNTHTVKGTVDRFTKAPRGEVDGAVLDDGTWLHWPPHMQARFKDILREGDRARATGRTETGPAGDTHFEVQSVTNLRTDATAENPDFGNGPPLPPPTERGVAPGRAVDREQRIRDLEDQVEQLRREIQRLRRDR